MKKVGVLVLMAVVALGATVAAAPSITVDNAIYDFGTVIEGVFVTHEFILSNTGDEPLTITRVRVACGCTTTTLSKTTLAPGESVRLEGSLDTYHYKGRISKNIYVESNDPQDARLALRFTGVVTQPQPYHISISDLDYSFYLLIDLRDNKAYQASHLMGAINIPLAELGDWMIRLPQGILIILYDQRGAQSDIAAQALNDKGFSDAKSLMGGLDEWINVYKDRESVV